MRKKLSELKPGESARIVQIDPSVKSRIAGMGMRVGEKVKLASRQPFRGPLVVVVKGRETSLGKSLASLIVVEVKE